MISIRGIDASYNGKNVLQGIDLEVGKGDFTGLLGPNGSGKTTLLRCITGSLCPSSGLIRILGRKATDWRPKNLARKMAFLPQETFPGFDFRVEEVIAMGRYPHMGRFSMTDPGGRVAVRRAIKLCNLEGMEDKAINQLSGGERQRVFIARSLAQEPEILLLDEPTKNLDIRHSMDIMDLVKKMNGKRGTTVLAVLHDIDLAARFCDRIALLRNGKLVKEGEAEEVLTEKWIEKVFDIRCRVHRDHRLHLEVLD
jgi:iron complex transport system ATP-binding protein